MKRWTAPVLFLGFFALYLHSMAPGLAPYRDTGEFVVGAATLGVDHPPGYPLYTLLARVSTALGLAEPAYRVSVLSCLAGAGAIALLFAYLLPSAGAFGALAAAAALGLNRAFWAVTTVPEMYSLAILAGLALWVIASGRLDRRRVCLLAFAGGLSLGLRMDLVLYAPALLLLLWKRRAEGTLTPSRLAAMAGFFLLGFSIFLYLPLRSSAGPLLDWNHPASLESLWASITRRGYGSTLDLLSKNYRTGELFGVSALHCARHVLDSFGWVGTVLALVGALRLRRDVLSSPLVAAWLVTGPLFLFLANLPPNPHALAIVEPHYLMADLMICFWLARGAGALLELPRPAAGVAAAALLVLELGWLAGWHHGAACRRSSFHLEDFVRNALRLAPEGSVLVAKKDVQIFGLWYGQEVRGLGRQTAVVAQGLSGTPWYQRGMLASRQGLRLAALRDKEGWDRFIGENRRVAATPDAELQAGLPLEPYGLLVRTGEAGGRAWEFMAFRGEYRYESAQDFFRADLADMVSQARLREANRLLKEGKGAEAAAQAALAWAVKWMFPDAPLIMGFESFKRGDYPRAERLYRLSARLYDGVLELAKDYRALPEVTRDIRKSSAEPYVNLGVIREKLKDAAGAESSYLEALLRDPGHAKAYYNLGSLFWGKDWRKSAEAFRKASELEPSNAEYRRYWRQAQKEAKKEAATF